MQARSLRHIWHPCSQMKDYEMLPPLELIGASGSYIVTKDNRKIFDAISSWWCKSLGHQHPRIKQALLSQLNKFEHVIMANTCHETIVALSEKLASLMPALTKVFYASDGSCAVEIAMKMSLHARVIQGDKYRKQFIALENAYHGETVGAMSVSDLGIYRDPYQAMLFDVHFIKPLPYVHTQRELLWNNCELQWRQIESQLEPYRETATAILIEPIVQAAGGMKLYSQDSLRRLRKWSQENNVHLIADEIMTGLGRTGKMLACEHAEMEPDFICLSKGLTAGWLPMSAVITRQKIYDIFYADYAEGKSFLHSHTHSGNALAASVALEVLSILEEDQYCEQVANKQAAMFEMWEDMASSIQEISNIRGIGGIIAADLTNNKPERRFGFDVYRAAIELGALLRPLGNTIYWAPPFNSTLGELEHLKSITEQAIKKVLSQRI